MGVAAAYGKMPAASKHALSFHQWGRKHCLHQNHVVHQYFV
jgi:hypothetical protein